MAAAIERFGKDHSLATEIVDAVNIALDELVANVVRHGHDDGQAHPIDVALRIEGDRLLVEIADDGRPFNPLERSSPDVEAPLEERAIGGLGIHFVRTLMDEVAYRRESGRNILRMVKAVHRD
jgi:anti-sigma regulatory factor (Ser/Thr protein kinase)